MDSIITDHRRQWRDCLYVYPVIARRSKGLSIGVNLNIDKRCNFRCVYCQIERHRPRKGADIDVDRLRDELRLALSEACTGRLWAEDRFSEVSPGLRRINDIAVSGDGEPTTVPGFPDAVRASAGVLSEFPDIQDSVEIVVITNSTNLGNPEILEVVEFLAQNNGRVWAKLDAGTDEYFMQVNRPRSDISLDEVTENIIAAARIHPVVIQTLMFRSRGQDPPPGEIEAWIERLKYILDSGGEIELVQLHTVARPPAEQWVSPIEDAELDRIARVARARLPGTAIETFYSPSTLSSE